MYEEDYCVKYDAAGITCFVFVCKINITARISSFLVIMRIHYFPETVLNRFEVSFSLRVATSNLSCVLSSLSCHKHAAYVVVSCYRG